MVAKLKTRMSSSVYLFWTLECCLWDRGSVNEFWWWCSWESWVYEKRKDCENAIIKCRVCSSLLNWLVNRILLRFVKLLLVGWLERERWSWKIPFISLTVILYLISILIYSLTRTEREYVSSRLPVASLTDFTIHLSSFISTSAVKFYALFSLQGFLMVVKTACSIVPIGNVVKMENDLCNGVCSLFENVAIFDCVRNLKSKSKSS